ncbi:hypothetical protein Hanom_Chr13g01234781 [Helianthus anomalus]
MRSSSSGSKSSASTSAVFAILLIGKCCCDRESVGSWVGFGCCGDEKGLRFYLMIIVSFHKKPNNNLSKLQFYLL